jgi:phage terminase Nu1 subunit (DNA packaging protein)
MAGDGKRLNRTETATLFGVDLKTVDAWRRAGCPCEEDGRNVLFHSGRVFQWHVERERQQARGQSSVDVEKERALVALDRERLKLATELQQVVAVDEVAALIEDEYASVRGRLLVIPGNVAQRVAGMVEDAAAAQVVEQVRAEIGEALEELSGDLERHRGRDDPDDSDA